jgi:hypothetical protein
MAVGAPVEALKNVIQFFGENAISVVPNLNRGSSQSVQQVHFDWSVLGGIFICIFDQVQDHLFELIRAGQDLALAVAPWPMVFQGNGPIERMAALIYQIL